MDTAMDRKDGDGDAVVVTELKAQGEPRPHHSHAFGNVAIALLMVVSGSANTITTKLADITDAPTMYGDHRREPFFHPFVQATCMFAGEMLCLVAAQCYFYFSVRRQKDDDNNEDEERDTNTKLSDRKNYNPFIFFVPAMCDMTATSLMYVGLNYTYSSVFQMLRGAVILFTALFSRLFLGRRLAMFQWAGMVFVLIGLFVVGVSSIIQKGDDDSAPHPLAGDLIIVGAQLIVAAQMTIEEKFLGDYDIHPLMAVGWEGVFGFSVMSVLLVVFYHIPGESTGGKLENAPDAFYQITHSTTIFLAILGNVISIAFFNFAGVSVTKRMSATTRMVLDSVRTVVIWAWSLSLQWQEFFWLQPIGFALLILGMFVYNGIVSRWLGWHGLEGDGVLTVDSSSDDDVPEDTDDSVDDETHLLRNRRSSDKAGGYAATKTDESPLYDEQIDV